MTLPPALPIDEELRASVLARFAAAEYDLANVRVGVLNSVANLTGSLTSLESYYMAAALAAAVPGIRGVVNRIEAPGAPSPSRKIDLDLKPDLPFDSKGE